MSLHIVEVVEVKFDYDAEQSDELTIRVGDIIKSCKLVEEGWLEGELNGKRGVFPDNFVVNKEITLPLGLLCVLDLFICMYVCALCVCCVCVCVRVCVFVYVCVITHLHLVCYL